MQAETDKDCYQRKAFWTLVIMRWSSLRQMLHSLWSIVRLFWKSLGKDVVNIWVNC